eukprot:TRINITY_DN882_c0_g1_i1.p1 TRINITY_DN882_c0_g1~~TRINITY_DN882_c0_g1_i1.p1  ORF type:complete len:224 (+),score=34.37 TRINITY_DN882_c0_g1_i1:60-674(+)
MTKKLCILQAAMKEADWARLQPAIKGHYDVSGDGNMIFCKGVMEEVSHNAVVKPLLWLFRPLEALVPFNGVNIGCEVTHIATDSSLLFNRVFKRQDGKKVNFNSKLKLHNGELVEFIKGGLGMRLNPTTDPDGSLRMESLGYVLWLGPVSLYIPSFLVPFGNAVITETSVTPTTTRMGYVSTHPLLGRTMGYTGTFKINKAKLA